MTNGIKKVLIAYDGSAYADAALDDLRRAGLPREAETLIISVGEGLVVTSSPVVGVAGTAPASRRVTSAFAVAEEQAERILVEARGTSSLTKKSSGRLPSNWSDSRLTEPAALQQPGRSEAGDCCNAAA